MSNAKRPSWVTARLFSDPTANGVINRRILANPIVLSDTADLNEKEREQLLRLLTLVARKLASVWLHRERYRSIQDELVKALKESSVDAEVLDLGYSQELFVEFEEFLLQVKSTLDHLVKVPAVFVGANAWSLTTWGDKGKKVEQAVSRNLPKRFKHHADGIIDLVLKPHRVWLQEVISARDKVAHYLQGGVNYELFAVHPTESGDARVPMWSTDQTVADFLDVTWHNLFRISEDFIHVFLYLRVDQERHAFLRNPTPTDSGKPTWTIHLKSTLDDLRDRGVVTPHKPTS